MPRMIPPEPGAKANRSERALFTAFEGNVTIAEEPLASSVEVTIQADSFDSRDAGRDEHVRSADFLDVENHPTLTYRSTGVRIEDGDWKVDGELTIRGTTKPVTLDLDIDGEERTVSTFAGSVDGLLEEQDVDILAWAMRTAPVPERRQGEMMRRLQTLDYIKLP